MTRMPWLAPGLVWLGLGALLVLLRRARSPSGLARGLAAPALRTAGLANAAFFALGAVLLATFYKYPTLAAAQAALSLLTSALGVLLARGKLWARVPLWVLDLCAGFIGVGLLLAPVLGIALLIPVALLLRWLVQGELQLRRSRSYWPWKGRGAGSVQPAELVKRKV